MQAYGEFVRRLRNEFDLEPSAETRGLAETIRARGEAPGARMGARIETGPAAAAPPVRSC